MPVNRGFYLFSIFVLPLFLFQDPASHKRIIDSTEKYELRKK